MLLQMLQFALGWVFRSFRDSLKSILMSGLRLFRAGRRQRGSQTIAKLYWFVLTHSFSPSWWLCTYCPIWVTNPWNDSIKQPSSSNPSPNEKYTRAPASFSLYFCVHVPVPVPSCLVVTVLSTACQVFQQAEVMLTLSRDTSLHKAQHPYGLHLSVHQLPRRWG